MQLQSNQFRRACLAQFLAAYIRFFGCPATTYRPGRKKNVATLIKPFVLRAYTKHNLGAVKSAGTCTYRSELPWYAGSTNKEESFAFSSTMIKRRLECQQACR